MKSVKHNKTFWKRFREDTRAPVLLGGRGRGERARERAGADGGCAKMT